MLFRSIVPVCVNVPAVYVHVPVLYAMLTNESEPEVFSVTLFCRTVFALVVMAVVPENKNVAVPVCVPFISVRLPFISNCSEVVVFIVAVPNPLNAIVPDTMKLFPPEIVTVLAELAIVKLAPNAREVPTKETAATLFVVIVPDPAKVIAAPGFVIVAVPLEPTVRPAFMVNVPV